MILLTIKLILDGFFEKSYAFLVDKETISSILKEIWDVYSCMGDSDNAIFYTRMALVLDPNNDDLATKIKKLTN